MEDLKLAAEIEALKARMDSNEKSNEKRFDKIDHNIDKIWQTIDQYREASIKTQTLVERLSKDLNDSRLDNARTFDKVTDKLDALNKSINESDKGQDGQWKEFWQKAAWGLIGVVGAIILYKLGLFK